MSGRRVRGGTGVSAARGAFTLVEVALALAVLMVGITAATAMYVAGLRWAGEARAMYSAVEVGRLAIRDPSLLQEEPGVPSAFKRSVSEDAGGWLNSYYVQRQVVESEVLPAEAGRLHEVRASVYTGGDAEVGTLVAQVQSSLWERLQEE